MSHPTATYRLQFRDGMTFDTAVKLVPYWQTLGISHLYASPIFSATDSSTHGYDVTDANRIDDAIGGEDGFYRLSDALQAAGIGLILDIVPNHMAASLENPWWRSVVEWGQDSLHAGTYDIDWTQNLTLPFLGDPIDDVIASGDLDLAVDNDNGCLAVSYMDTAYPIHPSSYPLALAGLDSPLANAILTEAAQADPVEPESFHAAIRTLCANANALTALQEKLRGQPKATLDDVLTAQPWRLIYWKDAAAGLSYRRFFEVTGLVGMRVEDDAVFEQSHRLVLDLVRAGRVDGIRVDHIDGLSDPAAYLKKLRQNIGPQTYLVVEKILAEGEMLPADWPVSGTTGYEFITALSNLFVDADGLRHLTQAYDQAAGHAQDYATVLDDAKTLMLTENFAGEVDLLVRLCTDAWPEGRPWSEVGTRVAVRALLKGFPVYRTYGEDAGLSSDDAALLDRIALGARDEPNVDGETLDAVVASLKRADAGAARLRRRFQQVSGPVMAKAMEDTTFYRFNRFLALNEVGGEPSDTHLSVARFHAAMAERMDTQPQGLSATSTHDTKRGEDARARLYALSEAPDIWSGAVRRWQGINAAHRTTLADGIAPEGNIEWTLYQALVGVWPETFEPGNAAVLSDLRKRFGAYVEKMLREAKQRTNWSRVNEAYEAAVEAFVEAILSDANMTFLEDFAVTARPFQIAGLWNGLTQTLIKLTAPGIPDIYQGSETQDLSLVDPDNRRMPDYDALATMLSKTNDFDLSETSLTSGHAKLSLMTRTLAFRTRYPDLFENGRYVALDVVGPDAGHIIAFARIMDRQTAVVIAPIRGLYWSTQPRDLSQTRVVLPGHLAGASVSDVLAPDTDIRASSSIPLDGLSFGPYALLTTLSDP